MKVNDDCIDGCKYEYDALMLEMLAHRAAGREEPDELLDRMDKAWLYGRERNNFAHEIAVALHELKELKNKPKNIVRKIEQGGEWLATARKWIQWNVNGGDTLVWSSREPVSLEFCKLEELALAVAKVAYAEGLKDAGVLTTEKS